MAGKNLLNGSPYVQNAIKRRRLIYIGNTGRQFYPGYGYRRKVNNSAR